MGDPFVLVLRTPRAGPWRRFSNPVRVISAERVDDVHAALGEVQDAVNGGLYAAGFVTYEAAGAFDLPVKPRIGSLPLVCFGLFSADSVDTLARFPSGGSVEAGDWKSTIDHDDYLEAVRTIKGRIEAGDTYQINFTFRLTSDFSGDPVALMADLYAAQAGRWSAFVDIGSHAICSASPELFFLREQARLECHPMKGTAARGWWAAQDLERGEELRHSEKNRAENVMIVDMVRNDLGQIASTGSVRVSSLFEAERYPLQWQMISQVMADAPDKRLEEIFAAMFPSGSVTGAPKHSAMAIIRDLETTPRGIYTGAIGYLSPHGRAHFSVAIRTAVITRARHQVEFGVGSGIVWDSVDRDEYEECLVKAAMVRGSGSLRAGPRIPAYITGEHPDFQLLETLRWSPGAGFVLLDAHLDRLRESADCFGFAYDVEELRNLLHESVGDLAGPSKVRLLLGYDGSIVCEAADLEPLPHRPLRAALAVEPVDPADVFLFHKTTRRSVYERARAGRPDAEAVILWNTSGEVTEATDYNVVIDLNGPKVTPPIASGLLPGTFRAQLLKWAEISERVITTDELQRAGGGWLINSVREWVPFTL